MTSPKEKGQRVEGVHHSEVSETLFRRADEGERKEERMAGRGVCLVIGYKPKVRHGLLSWLASTLCKSIIKVFVSHHHVLSLIVS